MRVTVILATLVVVLAAASWTVATYGSATGLARGTALYPHRGLIDVIRNQATRPPPDVVWMGDSTIYSAHSYPFIIERGDLRGRGFHGLWVVAPGLDFYAFHSLVGEVLARRPRVVVLIANLRLFDPRGSTTRSYDDLTALVPAAYLPTMLVLPFEFRGMTLPRLLLTRLVRYEWAEQAWLSIVGVRAELQEEFAWSVLGSETAPRLPALGRRARKLIAAYQTPLTPRQPLVRFAAATVARITRAGAAALVVISPVSPVMLDASEHGRTAVASGTRALRKTLEAQGARVLDLHAALASSLFSDPSGHFTPQGMVRMRELVWPTLADLLGVGPTSRPAPRTPTTR